MKNLTLLFIFILIIYIIILQNYIVELEENLDNILITPIDTYSNVNIKFDLEIKNENKAIFPKYLNVLNLLSDLNNNKFIYCKSYFNTLDIDCLYCKYFSINNLSSTDKLSINTYILNNLKLSPEMEILEHAFYELERNAIIYSQVLENIRTVIN